MKFTEGNIYHNFILKSHKRISEIECDVFIFEHTRLKNKVIAIKNSDNNKSFCAGFQTIPTDSTGVPHILEHSVLSGSAKYPVKDVFSELVKGGLTTFLNAMTYSDKTLYPFATRNEKEYFNLIDVYLDLTLNPLLDEDTFYQEGWHYHIESESDPVIFNGIVLNEMKGAYSDPIRGMWEKLGEYLLPGSTYAHSSGGLPKNIPDLTYEAFKEFHKKFYHPSKCNIALYGDADLDKELSFLEERFFKHVQKVDSDIAVALGNRLSKPVDIKESYPATDEDGEIYIGIGVDTGHLDSLEKVLALDILVNILINSEASVLKREILKARVGTEIGCINNETLHNFIFIYVMGTKEKHKDTIVHIYSKVLKDIVENGFDHDLILSEINSFEFHKREQMNSAKRGIDYVIESISSLFYNMNLFASLNILPLLAKIKEEALNNRYFEKLISELLLENKAMVTYTLVPDTTKAEKEAKLEAENLKKFKSTLDQSAIQNLVEKSLTLKKKQQSSNTLEQLQMLPKLKLGDITYSDEKYNIESLTLKERPVWISDYNTNGILYFYIGFKTDDIPEDLLPYLTVFAQVMTEIGTSKVDYVELAKKINIFTGGINSSFANYSFKNRADYFQPYIWFEVRCFENYLDETWQIMMDIFQNSQFDNRDRLGEILERVLSGLYYHISSEGYYIPVNRVMSYLSTKGRYDDSVEGFSVYENIKNIKNKKEAGIGEAIEKMKSIYNILINRKNILIHVVEEKKVRDRVMGKIEQLLNILPENSFSKPALSFQAITLNQAFITSSDVVYAVMGGNLFNNYSMYTGVLEVARKYIDRDYLYNAIRVQGGAYGNFSKLNPFTGNLTLISYRDPNIVSTFEAYRKLPDALKNIKISDYELEQIKISTYSGFDPALNNIQKGVRARNDLLHGVDREDHKKVVNQILQTTKDDIRQVGEMMESYMKSAHISIIGSSEKIKKQKSLFSEIIKI